MRPQGERVEATSKSTPKMMRRRVHLGERGTLTSLTCAPKRNVKRSAVRKNTAPSIWFMRFSFL
ncbi:MAG: hypothetical protein AOA65_1621 [Candidatus Bathyarchaeota archaeon BA1]|nr:MAG: hypothetical protein AOA65_1621 [Candidatus Bathyarchaeota archaeon BA1]